MSSGRANSYEAGSNFRPAFFFLAPDQRRALSAFYGYARAVDDIADSHEKSRSQKEAELALWKSRLDAIFSGGGLQGTLEEELDFAIRTFGMRKENFILLLEGVGMDVQERGYETFEELKYYMYRVAVAVGLSCLEIFRYTDARAAAIAENIGYAVQLTNIIRDVFEDAGRGRLYLPLEDLKKFDCRPETFSASIYPQNYAALMRFETERARGFYAKARELAAGQEKNKLLSAFVMAEIYSELLATLEAREFKTAGGRIRLGAIGKMKAVYKAWRNIKRGE